MHRSAIVVTVASMLALGSAAFAQTTNDTAGSTQGSSMDQQTQGSSTSQQPQGSSMDQQPQGSSMDRQTQGSSIGQPTQGSTMDRQSQGSSMNQPAQGSSTSQQLEHLSGVITSIDPSTNTLTVVTPASNNSAAANAGKSLMSANGQNLVSVKAPIDQQAPIMLDGKTASLTSLKEGEVVRTSFDPKTNKFESVTAVTQQQIDQDVGKARNSLSQDLNKLHLGSGQSSGQQNNQTNQ